MDVLDYMENIRLCGIRIFFAYWMLIEDWTLNIVCTYVGKCPSHNIWKCLVWQNLVEVEEQGQESILLSLSASKVSEACSFRFFQVDNSIFDLILLWGFDPRSCKSHIFRVVNAILFSNLKYSFLLFLFLSPFPPPLFGSGSNRRPFQIFYQQKMIFSKKFIMRKRQINLLAARPLAELTLILPEKKRSE